MTQQQKNIATFFIQHPDFFRKIVSAFCPLSQKQMVNFMELWDWQKISENKQINWNAETIKCVAYQLDWDIFTANPSAFKDLSTLHVFDHLINWKGDENTYCGSIAYNSGLPWNKAFIEQYKEKINFKKLSTNTAVEWSEELVELYLDKWDFEKLAMNNSFPWTIALFEKYLDTSLFFYFDVKNNEQLTSNINFVEKYAEHMEWSYIFANPALPWIEQGLMKRWEKRQVWFGIACNPVFFQNDPNFFVNNLSRWHKLALQNSGKAISQNTALPWSVEFIEKYHYLWNWKMLSTNEHIPWTIELIERLEAKLLWGGIEPCELLDECGNVVSEFGGISYQDGLINNESLPWSIEFINHFSEFIDFTCLAENEGVWKKALKPYVTPEMIEIVGKVIL